MFIVGINSLKTAVKPRLGAMMSFEKQPSATAAGTPVGILTTFLREIGTALRFDESRGAMRQTAQLIQRFSARGLQDYLKSIISSSGELGQVAARSYLHGNGFFKIQLGATDSFVVRLHVWEKNTVAEENLHSHRWPFVSTIVLGVLTSESWIDAIGEDASAYPEVIYCGKDEPLISIGQSRVKLSEVRQFHAGDCYEMVADQLHRIVNVADKLTVTLMVRPRATRSWARNIITNDRIPNVKPSYISGQELRVVLEQVHKALEDRVPNA